MVSNIFSPEKDTSNLTFDYQVTSKQIFAEKITYWYILSELPWAYWNRNISQKNNCISTKLFLLYYMKWNIQLLFMQEFESRKNKSFFCQTKDKGKKKEGFWSKPSVLHMWRKWSLLTRLCRHVETKTRRKEKQVCNHQQ